MKKYLTELIGTFFFTLTLLMAANNGNADMASFAAGAMLMVMTYAGRQSSGAHYNPAVSLSVLMRSGIDRVDFFYYLTAQFAGAGFAGILGSFLLGCTGALDIRAAEQHQAICALLSELLGAFAIGYVWLHVMKTQVQKPLDYDGLSIGFTFTAVAYGIGGHVGWAFNPALALGMTITGMLPWTDLWIYAAGPLLGAATAATVFQVQQTPDEG